MADDDNERRTRCSATTAQGTRCRKMALPGSSKCAHHSFKVPGRPTKLTADLTDRILDAVLAGAYLETSAQAVGISKSALHNWLRRGEELEALAREHMEPDAPETEIYDRTDPAEWIYLDFLHSLKSAEAYSEIDLLQRVRGAGLGWQAFATILERRFPDRWGRRKVLDHTFKGELDERRRVEIIVPDDGPRASAVARILASSGSLDEADLENTHEEEDPNA